MHLGSYCNVAKERFLSKAVASTSDDRKPDRMEKRANSRGSCAFCAEKSTKVESRLTASRVLHQDCDRVSP